MSGLSPFLLAAVEPAVKDLSMFNPASPQAGSISHMTWLIFTVSAFIFVVVEGILFYSIWRFRRRPTTGTSEPPQIYGSKAIEIAWTAAPALVVFVFILVTVRTLWEVNIPPPEPKDGDNTLFVTVIGHQWWWEYTYTSFNGRKLNFTTGNELHVPSGSPVHLLLKSADVCHSFWVPRLAGKTDLIPGHDNTMWFTCDRPDLYVGQCAEYCGTQHANMLLRVVVDTPEHFKEWLEDEAKDAGSEGSDMVRKGRAVFLSQSCAECHQVRGTPARKTVGPDLTHLMRRKTLAAGMIPNTPERLREWIDDPQKTKPGCVMPAFSNLGKHERDDLIEYLLSLH